MINNKNNTYGYAYTPFLEIDMIAHFIPFFCRHPVSTRQFF